MTTIAQGIQRQVRGDAKHPGGELGRWQILATSTIYAQKALLREILGCSRIPHHAVEEVDHRRAIFTQQKLERRIVSGLHVQHQLDVGPGHSLHIVSNPLAIKKLRFGAALSNELSAVWSG